MDQAELKRVCSSKRRYRNESQALLAAWRSESLKGLQLTFYRCPNCSSYHLTRSHPNRNGGVLKNAEVLSSKKKRGKK